MERKNTAITWYILLALSAVLTLVTLFSNWFGVSLFSYSYNTTLLKIAKLVTNLSDYIDSDAVTFFASILYCFLIISVVCAVITIRSLLIAHSSSVPVSNALFISSILLSSVVILGVFIVNTALQDEMYGLDLFELTYAPFIVLLGGITGCCLSSKVSSDSFDADRPHNTQNKVQKFVVRNTEPQTDALYCTHCQKSVSGSFKFCPDCGTELIPNTLICPNCGERLPRDTAFCPHCAQNLEQCQQDAFTELRCPHCGTSFDVAVTALDKMQFCPTCGISMSATPESFKDCRGTCPYCGNYYGLGAFCPACGHVVPDAVYLGADT